MPRGGGGGGVDSMAAEIARKDFRMNNITLVTFGLHFYHTGSILDRYKTLTG